VLSVRGEEFCGAWSLGPSASAEREPVWLFVGREMARVLVPRQLPFHRDRVIDVPVQIVYDLPGPDPH